MNKFKALIKNPTLFSILGPLTIIGLIIYLTYLFIYENGGELEGLFVLLGILLIPWIILLDRKFARFFNNKLISVIELFICVCMYLFCAYHSREAVIDLSNSGKPYIVVIDDHKGVSLKDFKSTGLFNKTYTVH
ncbi:MAG TPA: hypothetical protein VHS53_03950, partial [Mucilaginibacter sp.]|nr:hypothetical protein [Mucilaginibacter sp.]